MNTARLMYPYEEEARERLPETLWAYLAGGSETETALARNRRALDEVALIPRVLVNSLELDTSSEFLSQRLSLPVLLAPVGSAHLIHSSGIAGIRQAAEAAQLAYAISANVPGATELAVTPGRSAFYQIYVDGDEHWLAETSRAAIGRGHAGVILTVDAPVFPARYRDQVTHNHASMRNLQGTNPHRQGLDWKVLERLIVANSDIPFIVKGIQDSDDALRAAEIGAAAVYLSNHGGRQYDQGPGIAGLLPEVAGALAGTATGKVPLVVDGAVRSGNDLLKLLALGADLVALGRGYLYPWALGGGDRLSRYLSDLKHQVHTNMALLGVTRLEQLRSLKKHRPFST